MPMLFGGGTAEYPKSAVFLDQRDTQTNAGAMNQGNKWFSRLFNTEDYNDIPTYVELLAFAVTAVNTGTNKFTVAGDQRAYFPTGHRFDCRGSTGNDSGATPYVVTGTALNGSDTEITVASITDATADGTLCPGMIRFLQDGTYDIEVVATAYKTSTSDMRLVNISGYSFTAGYVSEEGGTKTDALLCKYTSAIDSVGIDGPGMARLTVSANDVWEVQQYTESAVAASGAQGNVGGATLNDPCNYGVLKVTTVA